MSLETELIEPVKSILDNVKRATGKDIRFMENNDLTEYANVKMARENMAAHLVLYKAKHDDLINYLVAHECGHVLRAFGVPKEKRLMPDYQ